MYLILFYVIYISSLSILILIILFMQNKTKIQNGHPQNKAQPFNPQINNIKQQNSNHPPLTRSLKQDQSVSQGSLSSKQLSINKTQFQRGKSILKQNQVIDVDKIVRIYLQNQNYKTKQIQLQRIITKLRQQSIVKKPTVELKGKQQQVQSSSEQISKLKNNQQKIKLNKDKIRLQIENLQKQLKIKQNNLMDKTNRLQIQAQQLTKLQVANTNQEKSLKQFQKNRNELQNTKTRLQSELKNLKNDQKQLTSKNKQQQGQLKDLKFKYIQLQNVCKNQKAQLEQFKRNLIQQQKQYENVQIKLQTSKKQKQYLEDRYHRQTTQLKKINTQQIDKINMDNNEINRLQYKISEVNNKIALAQEEIKKLKRQLDKLQDQKQQLQQARYQQMFQKEVLTNQSQAKQFLTNEIQKFKNTKIKFTRLLYAFHPQNKTNFHKFFDKVPNICVVIHVNDGPFIAGYSSKAFNVGASIIEGGLLISLTNRKSYKCLQGKRAIIYDEFNLIFGNDQIRILTNDILLHSNFGINNMFYQNKGDSLKDFIGSKDSPVQMSAYQIYQVVFSNQ